MPEALINSKLLTWSRLRAGMEPAQLAREAKASLSQVSSWEAGQTRPSLTKAMQLAQVLRVPFGYLFLSSPPREQSLVPDLRTVDGVPRRSLSVDLRDVINNALLKQQWFKGYRQRQHEEGFPFGNNDFTTFSDEDLASFLREVMGWSDDTRRESNGAGPYLSTLVAKAENLGILVLRSGVVGSNNKRKLKVDDFRGFALADEVAPVIFVNSNDAKTAQVFTFAHELSHVWLGRSGISNPEHVALTREAPALELRCNSVAANLVAPAEEFRAFWKLKPIFSSAANHFRISEVVALRRAYDLDLIGQAELKEKISAIPNRVAKKSSGGNFHLTLLARSSPLFTKTILADVKHGATGYREAARLLSVKPGTIQKLEKVRLADR